MSYPVHPLRERLAPYVLGVGGLLELLTPLPGLLLAVGYFLYLLWRKVVNHYRTAGLPQEYAVTHLLRPTTGTGMYRHSKDFLRVTRIQGHASPTTSIYANTNQSELRRTLEG